MTSKLKLQLQLEREQAIKENESKIQRFKFNSTGTSYAEHSGSSFVTNVGHTAASSRNSNDSSSQMQMSMTPAQFSVKTNSVLAIAVESQSGGPVTKISSNLKVGSNGSLINLISQSANDNTLTVNSTTYYSSSVIDDKIAAINVRLAAIDASIATINGRLGVIDTSINAINGRLRTIDTRLGVISASIAPAPTPAVV